MHQVPLLNPEREGKCPCSSPGMNSMEQDYKAVVIVFKDCHKVTYQVICDLNWIGQDCITGFSTHNQSQAAQYVYENEMACCLRKGRPLTQPQPEGSPKRRADENNVEPLCDPGQLEEKLGPASESHSSML